MMMQRRTTNLHPLVFGGLALLMVANLSHWLLPRMGLFSESMRDFVVGLLYGVCIGFLLLGIYFTKRQRQA